jgi:multidrug efflux pump subunit AcrB
LRDIAQYKIRPLLSTIRGVSRVQVQGGALREYRVVVNPERMQALGLTLSDVAKALSASNILSSVGKLQDHDRLYLIISDSRFTNLKRISHVVLRTGDNGVIRLSDVARVEPNIRTSRRAASGVSATRRQHGKNIPPN